MKKTKNGKTFFLEGEIIIFSSINLFENNYIRFSYIILFVITRAGSGFIYFFRERKTYFEIQNSSRVMGLLTRIFEGKVISSKSQENSIFFFLLLLSPFYVLARSFFLSLFCLLLSLD